MANDVERAQTQLLVAIAQAVLTLHQIGAVPTQLRTQITKRVEALEIATEEYARLLAKVDAWREVLAPPAQAAANVLYLDRSRDDPTEPTPAA